MNIKTKIIIGFSALIFSVAFLLYLRSDVLIVRGATSIFGNTATSSTYDTHFSSNIYGSKFTLTGSGTLESIYAYIDPGSGNLGEYAIYNSSLGFIASSSRMTYTTTPEWKGASTTASLAAGDYWLLFNANASYISFYYSAGGDNQGLQKAVLFGTWPSTITSPNYSTNMYSIYAIYDSTEEEEPPATTATSTFSFGSNVNMGSNVTIKQ